jgi:hypothetical protein
MTTHGQGISREDEYANAYFYFIKSLKILAEDANAQCEAMDYFNVLNLCSSHISREQREAILRILEELASLPKDVLNVANVRMEHIRTMQHPAWKLIRAHAKDLLCLLGPETKRVEAILGNADT